MGRKLQFSDKQSQISDSKSSKDFHFEFSYCKCTKITENLLIYSCLQNEIALQNALSSARFSECEGENNSLPADAFSKKIFRQAKIYSGQLPLLSAYPRRHQLLLISFGVTSQQSLAMHDRKNQRQIKSPVYNVLADAQLWLISHPA